MTFAATLTDWKAPPPPGLKHGHRFGVYRNNVASALIRALAVRYPAVERLVGQEFFAAMAGAYALSNLPASPVLSAYGEAFPEYIAGFEPARSLAYLADVARLESAWWRAYHAADEAVAGPQDFAAIAPERLGDLRIIPHPSVSIVRSPYAVVSIWRRQRGDGGLNGLDLAQPQCALVTRPDVEVEVMELTESEADVFAALLGGGTLSRALAESPLELTPLFTRLIASRIASALVHEDTP